MINIIHPIPAFSDNYIWAASEAGSKRICVVDPGDAEPVIAYLESNDLELSDILITHHHPDHTGGIQELCDKYGCRVVGPNGIRGITEIVDENDHVDLFGLGFSVIEVPGHTLDHIAYYCADSALESPILFCGDTLFAAGCGRLFEGTADMMHKSLGKLRSLPNTTRVYCTHEYTLANLAFAVAADSDNSILKTRIENEKQKRAADVPTLPSTIELELATNPFLRCSAEGLRRSAETRLGRPPENDVEVFSALEPGKIPSDSFVRKSKKLFWRYPTLHYLVKHTAAITAFMLLTACQNLSDPTSNESDSPSPPTNKVEISTKEVVVDPLVRSNEGSSSVIETPIIYTDLWQRMRAGFQLQEHYDHPNVARYLESYSNQQRYFDLMHERASPFLYWIVEEIDKRDLPLEFALLPMVESTYNPNAYSQEHAVGLWQFLGATGSSFGLQQDWWFDGRRDPYASTSAALDYMQQLYAQFNEDWLLAIAAYNTGDGNLRRAIRNSASEDIYFWDLNLPGETEAHIPKLLALAAIVSSNEAWGIELQALPNEAVLDTVDVGTQIDMSQAAKLAEIDYEELRALNPGYLQWATHPDQPQRLRLPPRNAKILSEALVGLDKTQLLTWDRYEIRPGDTLGAIARRLDTRVDILQTFNDLAGSRIVAGESLLIPRTMDSELLAAAPRAQRNRVREVVQVPEQYSVRNGDNLWVIARRFDLRSTEIAAWNEIGLEELLQPGQILDLSYAQQRESEPAEEPQISGSASTYVVRRGDSMDAISRRFGIDLQNLLLWNGLGIGDLIFPGQELQVIPIESGSE